MVVIDVPPNPNCEPADLRLFNDVEAPRAVRELCIAPPGGQPPAWHELTGWTAENTPCPALGGGVVDSGEGLAFVVTGGAGGLRFRPSGSRRPWALDDPRQWGLPFLLVDTAQPLRYEGATHG